MGGLDVQLPPVSVHEHDEAARDGVAACDRLEDLAHRRLRVQRARERFPDLQQGGQALVFVRGAVRRGGSGRELGGHALCGCYYKNVRVQKWRGSNSDSAARRRQPGKTACSNL